MKINYDSTASLFWASEQCMNGIALASERSHAVHPEKSMFSSKQVDDYDKQAALLNARNDGDQASYLFQKVA